jgi:hypothetical protein
VSTVERFDAAKLGRVTRTPQGFLRAPARLTRTGVLTYRRKDGTVVRELRRPEQVFAPESLATLADAPLTDLHPREMVTPSNARTLSVGHVSHATQRADGKFVEAEVVVTDAAMISAIEAGNRREVSCGYKCRLIEGAGIYNGERYDAEQVDIVYNHCGLGPQNWGRAGSEVALRLDGAEHDIELGDNAARLVLDADDDSERHDRLDNDDDRKGKHMELVTVKVDGIDCQVAPQSAQVITRAVEKLETELRAARKDATDLKSRADSLQGELDGTKQKLEQASDPKRFDSAVAERIALLDHARKVLGATEKLDGLSAREIKERVIKHFDAKADFSGKSDEYVQGRFDAASELPATPSALDKYGQAIKPGQRKDSGAPSTYVKPPWQQPLASHRQD